MNREGLAFALGVVIVATILFGIAPAFQTAQIDVRAALNEGARGSTGGTAQRNLRGYLVIAEIALALVLLVGAGLLLRSFEQLQNVKPGFTPGNLLVADIPLSPRAHPQAAERIAFFD